MLRSRSIFPQLTRSVAYPIQTQENQILRLLAQDDKEKVKMSFALRENLISDRVKQVYMINAIAQIANRFHRLPCHAIITALDLNFV